MTFEINGYLILVFILKIKNYKERPLNTNMEIWKDITKIPRFTYNGGSIYNWLDFTGKGYQISSKGRLRNADKLILSNNKKHHGYITNNLTDIFGKPKTIQRHLIVLATFKMSSYKEGSIPFHIDSDKTNNSINNLEWLIKKETE